MRLRWGPGPVFAYEWLRTARRWQLYAVRSVFVAALGAGLTIVWCARVAGHGLTMRSLASVGEFFFYALAGTQLALVLLAGPAYTAGSICLDKAQGALVHLLVTDLSAAEIVLGKLAARLVPMLGLIACGLPVLFLAVLLGGIPPEAVLGALLVTLGVGILGCTLALAISVWGRKTHEVLMATYLVWIIGLLAGPALSLPSGRWTWGTPPDSVLLTNPFWTIFLPYTRPSVPSWPEQAMFLGITLGLSTALALLAILRVRSVTLWQTSRGATSRRQSRWFVRRDRTRQRMLSPSLDRNPVLWRECHRRRPSGWVRMIWTAYGVLATVSSLFAIADTLNRGGMSRGVTPHIAAAFTVGFQVSIGLLLFSVGSVTALAEERVSGSLDLLLVSPLPTRSIVLGKWWGAYRRLPWLALWPMIIAVACSWPEVLWLPVALVVGTILAYGAALTSLGLASSVWVPHLGRAVALTVSVYVMITIGWFFLMIVLKNDTTGAGLAAASPFYGPMYPIIFVPSLSTDDAWERMTWSLVWMGTYGLAAGGLFVATLKTFDRCLGRKAARRVPARARR